MSTESMITIDGADGGGQLLRTALSLSTILNTPFQIENIRRSRPNPGLKPQHLTAVQVVAELCAAEVTGDELDSSSLTFRPGTSRHSSLAADIGTAGSVSLLFDTVVPIAAIMDEQFQLRATGGTNVKWAPTIEYQQLVKGPLLALFGVNAHIECSKTGFYPTGGGMASVSVTSSSLQSITLDTRGDLDRVDVYSKASENLADRNVADRQATHAQTALEERGVPSEVGAVEYVSTSSTGSSLLLRGVYEQTTVGFDVLGERGRTSEEVADDAVRQFMEFHSGDAPVDAYMADQLMVYLALAGGSIRIPRVTAHVQTNLDLITEFGSDMRLDREADGTVVLQASALAEID